VSASESGWPTPALSDVCEVAPKDAALPPEAPFVPMDAVKVGERWPTYYEARGTRSGVRAQPGDVLFARITPCLENGKLAQVPSGLERVGGSTEFIVVRPGHLVDWGYLYYWCMEPSVRSKAKALMAGATGRMRLGAADLRQFRIPLPPMDEQRRIVALLEDHLSRLDAAQQGVLNALSRSSALRDAVLATAVAEAARSTGVVIERLGSLAKVSSGLTPLKGNRAFYDNGTIPWITSGDLHQGLITRSTQFVTQEALDQTTLKIVPAGSLLIAMYGEGKTRGTTAELGIDATTNQACAAIAVRDDALRPWVRLVLDANYGKLRRLAAGGVQPNLSLGVVKAIEIPLLRPDLRDELLARRTALDDAHSRLREQLDVAHRRGISLRRALLAAAFSGQLTAEAAAA